MSRTIGSVVATLAAGAALQRLAGLANSVLVARALGVSPLGELAFGLQLGATVSLLADSGVLAIAARQAAAEPARAGGWIRAAIRARLAGVAVLLTCALACLPFAGGDAPFLLLCLATALPACFELKGLSEAAGITRAEVRIDLLAATVQVGATAALVACGVTDLRWHAGATLAARTVYAGCALLVLRGLPRPAGDRPVLSRSSGIGLVAVSQAWNGLVQSGDVILLRFLATPAEVGLFAVAKRLAQVAEAPAALLGRAVQPHLDHAAAHGDAAGTLRRALSVAAWASLPAACGGWVVAGPVLGSLYGPAYEPAGWTLRWLLASAVIVAVGSRFGTMLLAMHRVREFAAPLLVGATLNLLLSAILIPAHGAAGSAVATLAAMTLVVGASAVSLAGRVPLQLGPAIVRPGLAAVAVAAAAAAVLAAGNAFLAVAAGAAVFAVGLVLLERDALRKPGAGLHAASGFGGRTSEPEGRG